MKAMRGSFCGGSIECCLHLRFELGTGCFGGIAIDVQRLHGFAIRVDTWAFISRRRTLRPGLQPGGVRRVRKGRGLAPTAFWLLSFCFVWCWSKERKRCKRSFRSGIVVFGVTLFGGGMVVGVLVSLLRRVTVAGGFAIFGSILILVVFLGLGRVVGILAWPGRIGAGCGLFRDLLCGVLLSQTLEGARFHGTFVG